MKRLIVFSSIVLFCFSVTAQTEQPIAFSQDTDFITKVLAGNICFLDKQISIADLPWNPHPKYTGVSLKNLISGTNTDNQLSCHIVKVEPNCVLDTHSHEGQIEIHEVVGGSGTGYLKGKETDYFVGKICVIPANTPHKVVAGKDGLYLFAKFTPVLQ